MIIKKKVVTEQSVVVCDLCEEEICPASTGVLPTTAFKLGLKGDEIYTEQHFCNKCGTKVYHAITGNNFWRAASLL